MTKKRRKSRYKTDPLTGMKYEKGSLIDMMNTSFSTPKKTYVKSKIKKHKKYRRNEPEIDLSDVPWWVWVALAVFVVAYLIYHYVILPTVVWISENYVTFIIGFIIAFLIFAFLVFLYLRSWKRKRAEILIFEEEQHSRGLEKFVDSLGNEKWGTPDQVKEWAEKDTLVNRIVEEIKEFTPARKELRNEYAYHLSLHSWLKKTFPDAVIEKQVASSRPDIIIKDIAIELKGPTDSNGIKTIADKCMRYRNYFPGGIIVVLFEVKANERFYDEWKTSMEKSFPKVKIIRK